MMDSPTDDKQHDTHTNKTATKSSTYTKEFVEGGFDHEEKTHKSEDDPETRCGYWSCRPKSLQCCNNPKCLLMFMAFFALAQDTPSVCDGDAKLQNFLYILILGQLFHGVGSATLFTVGLSLIDDSVPSSSYPLYIGIWYAFASFGPGVGYIVGGQFLSLYVDFQSVSDVDMTTDDPRWVGAWWLGFVLSAICFILAAIPISMFGHELPTAKHVRDTRVSGEHGGDEMIANVIPSKSMTLNELKYLPKQVCQLLKNPAFLFVTLGGLTEGLGAAGFGTFIPKFIENQYGVNATWAATLAGIVVVPGAVGGQFFGGVLCKRLNLTVKGCFRVPIVTCSLALLLTVGLWSRCDLSNISGISKDYADNLNVTLPELTTGCNENCHCDTEWYVPVCDSYGTQYFSPCHAGCTVYSPETKIFTNCACVPPDKGGNETSVTLGKCSGDCNMLYVYLPIAAVTVFLLFFPTLAVVAASLRCVHDSQRTFSLGIKLVLIRLLGTVPGPVIFGAFIDNACILWQEKCDEETSCWIYDKFQLSRNMFILLVCIKILSINFFSLAYKLYRPPKSVKASAYVIKTQSTHSENTVSNVTDTYL